MKNKIVTLLGATMFLTGLASKTLAQSVCPPIEVVGKETVSNSNLDGAVDYSFSPDESAIIYKKEIDDRSANGIYSVSVNGSMPMPLSILGAGANSYKFSPDNETLVYEVFSSSSVGGVYAVSLTGGDSVKLFDSYPSGTDFRDLNFSPDGKSAIVLYDLNVPNILELFSFRLDTGAVTQLSHPLAAGDQIFTIFKVSSRLNEVFYSVRSANGSGRGLAIYRKSLIVGSGPAQLISGTNPFEIVNFSIGDDDKTLLFSAYNINELFTPTLYRLPLTGGTPVNLGATRSSFNNRSHVDSEGWVIALDDSGNDTNLTSTAPGSTAAKILNGTLRNSGVNAVYQSGQLLIYEADETDSAGSELMRVPRDGSAMPQQISLARSGGRGIRRFELTPDKQTIVYRLWRDNDKQVDLFSVPVSGGPSTRLSIDLNASSDLSAYETISGAEPFFFTDDARVQYFVDRIKDGNFVDFFHPSVYLAPIAGGSSERVFGPPSQLETSARRTGEDLSETRYFTLISPSGNLIIYQEQFIPDRTVAGKTVSLNIASAATADCTISVPGDIFRDQFE